MVREQRESRKEKGDRGRAVLARGNVKAQGTALASSLLSPFSCSTPLVRRPAFAGLLTRRSLCDFEHVPAGFLSWFLVPSLQRNVLAELMADLASGEVHSAPVAAYA